MMQVQTAVSRSVCDAVNSIVDLAMNNHSIIHIHTDYAPHVNVFSVCAKPADTKYSNLDNQVFLMRSNRIELCDTDALDRLLQVESVLADLIIEVREQTDEQQEKVA